MGQLPIDRQVLSWSQHPPTTPALLHAVLGGITIVGLGTFGRHITGRVSEKVIEQPSMGKRGFQRCEVGHSSVVGPEVAVWPSGVLGGGQLVLGQHPWSGDHHGHFVLKVAQGFVEGIALGHDPHCFEEDSTDHQHGDLGDLIYAWSRKPGPGGEGGAT
ncbi:hypothetical protein [Mycobacterium sp.]|uniref:hypothetical protein n=1 Tax=Mycobacterium sp. TaxID=1785 RepID=UPI003C7896B4